MPHGIVNIDFIRTTTGSGQSIIDMVIPCVAHKMRGSPLGRPELPHPSQFHKPIRDAPCHVFLPSNDKIMSKADSTDSENLGWNPHEV